MTMNTLPTQRDAHLVVAALRVLRHLGKRPPTDEEIAGHLGLPREEVAHWARGLVRHGVLRTVESAFDVRFDLADHRLLETLPETADDRALENELTAFETKSRERHEDLTDLFGSAGEASRARTSKLENELKRFKQSGRARSPFDATAGADDEDEDA